MKLLLENWRRYQGEHDFNVLCENHTRRLITDTELIMLWENQVNNEIDLLISEGIMDTLAIGYEKGKQLVGKAKEMYEMAFEKFAAWEISLLNQVWALINKVKDSDALSRVGEALKKVMNIINKYCSVHPMICKIIKFLLMMMAISAVIAFFSSSAEAAVQVQKFDGGKMVLDDVGIDIVKGALQMAQDGADPETQQKFVDAYQWLESAHASETVHDLTTSSEQGARMCNGAWESVKGMTQGPDAIPGLDKLDSLRFFRDMGEKVVIKTHSLTRETLGGEGLKLTHIEWQSLATK